MEKTTATIYVQQGSEFSPWEIEGLTEARVIPAENDPYVGIIILEDPQNPVVLKDHILLDTYPNKDLYLSTGLHTLVISNAQGEQKHEINRPAYLVVFLKGKTIKVYT